MRGIEFEFRLFVDKDLGFDSKMQCLLNDMEQDEDMQSDDDQIRKATKVGIKDLKQAVRKNKTAKKTAQSRDPSKEKSGLTKLSKTTSVKTAETGGASCIF